ncbi:hypothetical protein [Pseudomonas sp. IT-P260]|uniref:hypothetical protein n=1 Tax=Pseudomonas sp. IT-P260 TaxID=3026457 RepID=UPI0039DF8196
MMIFLKTKIRTRSTDPAIDRPQALASRLSQGMCGLVESGHLPLGSTSVPLGRFAATMRALTVTA